MFLDQFNCDNIQQMLSAQENAIVHPVATVLCSSTGSFDRPSANAACEQLSVGAKQGVGQRTVWMHGMYELQRCTYLSSRIAGASALNELDIKQDDGSIELDIGL